MNHLSTRWISQPTDQILSTLRNHNCKDITHQLDLAHCGKFPVSNGGFGDVFKGRLQNGSPVAIKCLRVMVGVDDQEGQKQLRRAAHEMYVWSKCKHPNVLPLIGIAQYQDRIAMVSPWMERGSLPWFLSQNPTSNKYNMCVQIADGLAHLHANGIVHGDIKGSNILVSNDQILKLADFGTSSLSQYTAPEILMEETKLTTEGDVYALGMTILEVITRKVPYEESLEVAVMRKVISGIHPTRPERHMPTNDERSEVVWGLLTKCWAFSPRDRPSAMEAAAQLKATIPEARTLGSYETRLHNASIRSIPTSPRSSSNTSLQDEGHTQPSGPGGGEKLTVSIDFGVNFSAVAYGWSTITGAKVQQILKWPGSFEDFRKIPTCLLYGEHGEVLTWGLEAMNAPPVPGSFRCERFKLFLEPEIINNGAARGLRLPVLPPGKKPLDLSIDFLECLWYYARQQIAREIGAVVAVDTAEVWLTVPATWDAKGCDLMREAAICAGLVHSVGLKWETDTNWRERLKIITEPEAAAVHCAQLTSLWQLRPPQTFMICSAGGEAVDLAVYQVLGSLEHLEIGEMCGGSGKNCGSLVLDLRFRDLIKQLLERHPAHTDSVSLAHFQRTFSEIDMLAFRGEEDDWTPFQFNCFNVEDPHDPSVGLVNGELRIPGGLLRTKVFDPVISEILRLIEEQITKCDRPIRALLLVGGFSRSQYLFKRINQQFGSRIALIARPPDADTATCRGAARFGLANRPLVKLPADPEDWQMRPSYISTNNAGIPVCENRLQYLVQKGQILEKGQMVRTRLCKFTQGSPGSTFVTTLYTSDSEEIMRYTDEAKITELCKWTVDISSLPWLENENGFYTEFELGLEINRVEVRGILLVNGEEWGRVVFDSLDF